MVVVVVVVLLILLRMSNRSVLSFTDNLISRSPSQKTAAGKDKPTEPEGGEGEHEGGEGGTW